jgi:hypothetical protein
LPRSFQLLAFTTNRGICFRSKANPNRLKTTVRAQFVQLPFAKAISEPGLPRQVSIGLEDRPQKDSAHSDPPAELPGMWVSLRDKSSRACGVRRRCGAVPGVFGCGFVLSDRLKRRLERGIGDGRPLVPIEALRESPEERLQASTT